MADYQIYYLVIENKPYNLPLTKSVNFLINRSITCKEYTSESLLMKLWETTSNTLYINEPRCAM